MNEPTLKAYQISCRDDDYHGEIVVFAANGKAARKRDHRDCDCEFIDVYVRRAPTFDHLSPGPMTIEQYIEHGWQYECQCGKQVRKGDIAVIGEDRVWCSMQCVKEDREQWPVDPSESDKTVIDFCRQCDEVLAREEVRQ